MIMVNDEARAAAKEILALRNGNKSPINFAKKQRQRAVLNYDIEEFLKNGGKIERVPMGKTTQAPYITRRELSKMNFDESKIRKQIREKRNGQARDSKSVCRDDI